jgi:hypothetical protein
VAFAERAQAEVPDADPAFEWIWKAWARLHRGERPHGTVGVSSGLGAMMIKPVPLPLPWSAVRAWADHYGYGEEDFELLDHCIQALDDVYLRWWADAQKKQESG